jgi:hypothetical protein
MIYNIEVAGPTGFQVSVVCGQPASRWLVADFVSLEAAEAFVDVMRQLDTAPPHNAASHVLIATQTAKLTTKEQRQVGMQPRAPRWIAALSSWPRQRMVLHRWQRSFGR